MFPNSADLKGLEPPSHLLWGHHVPIVRGLCLAQSVANFEGRFPKSAEVLCACPKVSAKMEEETWQSRTQNPLLSAPLNKEEVPTAIRFLRVLPSTASYQVRSLSLSQKRRDMRACEHTL